MKKNIILGLGLAAALALAGPSQAADPPAPASRNAGATPSEAPPVVPPAAPGVFTVQKKGANRFHLVVSGHKFTSREAIEWYLAYQASEVTEDQKGSWFTLVEERVKGDTVPASRRDPAGLRYSFRMNYFRPVWRFKPAGAKDWKRWSPFSGAAFPESDAKASQTYEVSADILVHKGLMDAADPLAFDASAVNDFLVNQISPPQ
jgi:hypothetical protein